MIAVILMPYLIAEVINSDSYSGFADSSKQANGYSHAVEHFMNDSHLDVNSSDLGVENRHSAFNSTQLKYVSIPSYPSQGM